MGKQQDSLQNKKMHHTITRHGCWIVKDKVELAEDFGCTHLVPTVPPLLHPATRLVYGTDDVVEKAMMKEVDEIAEMGKWYVCVYSGVSGKVHWLTIKVNVEDCKLPCVMKRIALIVLEATLTLRKPCMQIQGKCSDKQWLHSLLVLCSIGGNETLLRSQWIVISNQLGKGGDWHFSYVLGDIAV